MTRLDGARRFGIANREGCVRGVGIGGWVRSERGGAFEVCRVASVGPVVIRVAHQAGNWTAIRLYRHWQVRDQLARGGHDVALPAGVDHGVSAFHCRPGERFRHLGLARRGDQSALRVAAVVEGEKQLAGTARRICRRQDDERRTELHAPPCISWYVVNIDDNRVLRIGRIDLHESCPGEHFVCPDLAPAHPAEIRPTLLDLEFDDTCIRGLHKRDGYQKPCGRQHQRPFERHRSASPFYLVGHVPEPEHFPIGGHDIGRRLDSP